MHKSPTLLLLIVAYVAATWFPELGLWARDVRIVRDEGMVGTWLSQVQPANVLLALLLFSSGLSSSWLAMQKTLSTHARLLLLSILTWGLPLFGAMLASAVLWSTGAPLEIALGVWMIACMPVANSSVGWTNVMRGNVPLSLALLIVSTCLSPFTSPLLIYLGVSAFGIESFGNASVAKSGLGMAVFFIVWVLLPVALGAWSGGRLSERVAAYALPVARRMSLIMLLLLNYLNGSACLPSLLNAPTTLAWPVAAALALLGTIAALYQLACRFVLASPHRSASSSASVLQDANDRDSRDTLLLGVTMRNTGVALVYTTAVLPNDQWISLTIIAYTIVQHLFVSLMVRPAADVEGKAASGIGLQQKETQMVLNHRQPN